MLQGEWVKVSSRREQILDAARAVFAEQGAAGISVRTVAARVGIGASTLRHYFPRQRDLRDAVFSSAFDAVLDDLRIGDPGVPARERLVECLSQFLPQGDTTARALEQWFEGVAALIGPDASPEQRATWSALARRADQRVTRWLEILDAEGAMQCTSPERATNLLLTVVDGLSLRMLLPEGPSPAEARALLGDAVAAVVM